MHYRWHFSTHFNHHSKLKEQGEVLFEPFANYVHVCVCIWVYLSEWRPYVHMLISHCNPPSGNCRLGVSFHSTWTHTHAHSHSHTRVRQMNEVLNAEVYFSTFFMWVRGIMLNTFALESSVLMLLNISLSNCVRRHSEGALWEERRRDRTSSKRSKYKLQHRGREMAKWKKRKWKRSVRAAKKEGKKKQEALFQVCFLLSVKAWEKTFMHYAIPCDRKMGIGANQGYRPHYPVMPEFIKGELLMHENLYGAVAITGSEVMKGNNSGSGRGLAKAK